jgi:hypothetical protein
LGFFAAVAAGSSAKKTRSPDEGETLNRSGM